MGDNVIDRSLDGLLPSSRNFYENALLKTVLSVVYAGFAIMYLGFCAYVGGEANSSKILSDSDVSKTFSDIEDAFTSEASGYGFASFCFFTSFALCLSAAIIISPLCLGSPLEKQVIRNPKAFETS